ncbi:EpsG family protein [Providencia hangzhouensis]|uniref:EpsG family protein n=1 Tax=Providencia hangzhouensis TaxID=3031799 RepID=UPI0034DD4FE9
MFFFSFIQALPLFIYFSILRNKFNFKVYIIFFLFMSVTGIYINQLNGIRQYAALLLFPLISYLCFNKQNFKSVFLLIISISLHQSAFIFLIIYPLTYIYRKLNIPLFFIFLITIPIYIFGSKIAFYIVQLLDLKYSIYFESKHAEPQDILNILTRLYYLPLIIYFFYIYRKNKTKDYFDFTIFLFSVFYFSFIMGYDFGLLSRIASYFWFFIIFPIYFIINKSMVKGNYNNFMLSIIYVLIPFILKTTLFARAEYSYQSILFN